VRQAGNSRLGALLRHPAVQEMAIVGMPDVLAGDMIQVYAVKDRKEAYE